MKRFIKDALPFSIFFGVFLIVCEFLVRAGFIASYLLPSPTSVLAVFQSEKGTLLTAMMETSKIAFGGFLLSLVFGLTFGSLMGIFRTLRKTFFPAAVFFQTVPIIAIAPLLVIWFGYGNTPVLLSSFIVSVFPILSSVVSGIQNTEKDYLTLAQLYGASVLRKFWHIQAPSSLIFIAGALRTAAGLAIVGTVVGEFMSGSGLGGLIEVARVQYRVDLVFAALACLIFLGLIAFILCDLLENKIRKRFTNSEF